MSGPSSSFAQAKPSRPILPFLGVAVLVLVAFLGGRASIPTSEPDPYPIKTAASEAPDSSARLLALERENQDLKAKLDARPEGPAAGVADLEASLRDKDGKIEALEKDIVTFRHALDNAVAELNALSRRKAAENRQQTTRQATPGTKTEKCCKDGVLVRPGKLVAGQRERVTFKGQIHNANGQAAGGYLYADLLEDGQIVETKRISLEIPARTFIDFRITFDYIGIMESWRYSYRAEWDVR